MSLESIMAKIRRIPGFPKPGIVFIDITPILQDGASFREVIEIIAKKYDAEKPDYIVGIESRGFILAAALALRLGCGFIPIRKAGKLPYKTIRQSYSLEYGSAVLEVHEDAVKPGDRVLVVDDLLATGGTARAVATLLETLKAEIVGFDFLIELDFCKGRALLEKYNVDSLLHERTQ